MQPNGEGPLDAATIPIAAGMHGLAARGRRLQVVNVRHRPTAVWIIQVPHHHGAVHRLPVCLLRDAQRGHPAEAPAAGQAIA